MKVPTREEAWELVQEYITSENLRKHVLSVEAVMRWFARKQGEDEQMWGVIGLAHDLDYDKYPDQHCVMTKKILEEQDWPPAYVRAILSHGWGICTDVKPESTLEKTLYAVDELTGLVTAVALMRPSKSILDTEASSVRKKWKEKRFAAGVDRTVIERGAEMLGVELGELIEGTIAGMREAADAIGLRGEGSAT